MTYVAIVLVFAFAALVAYAVWSDIERWASYRDPFNAQLDEIRSLPETPDRPFDCERAA